MAPVPRTPDLEASKLALPDVDVAADAELDAGVFALQQPLVDWREYLLPALGIVLLAITGLVPWRLLVLGIFLLWAFPRVVRLAYPHFMTVSLLDDLRIEAGATLSLFASITALLLQSHNTSISIAVKAHSEFYSRPLVRLLRTFLYVELALNGSSEEKEQTASWLRWMHRHIHGAITPEMQLELGIPENVTVYGYIDELKAYIMQTLTWATISFQNRFGRPLSQRAMDTIVLEYTCAGMRIGVPPELLTKTYADFLVSFNARLTVLSDAQTLTPDIVANVEASVLSAKKSWVTQLLVRCALMIGHALLPEHVRERYQLRILDGRVARFTQHTMMAVLWLIYPSLAWLPLRGMIALLCVLEASLRPVLLSSLHAVHSMDILTDKPRWGTGASAPHAADTAPPHVRWLGQGRDSSGSRRPFLQRAVVRILGAQLAGGVRTWLVLPLLFVRDAVACVCEDTSAWVHARRAEILADKVFARTRRGAVLPAHVGLVMDGNRRFARQKGVAVLEGHAAGARTAVQVLEWWLKFQPYAPGGGTASAPRALTLWAFSSDNFARGAVEVDGLMTLLTAELRSLAFTSLVHLFRVRVRIIGGDRAALPYALRESIALLEEVTAHYDGLQLQIALGYGGRSEIVDAVARALATGAPVDEAALARESYCARIGVAPVDVIVRTSEQRTSGFMLWDSAGAELVFIDKLWPQLDQRDWLHVLGEYGQRQIRQGK